MISTVKLINTSITLHNFFFFGDNAVSKFQVYNTVLTIISTLYIRSSNLIFIIMESLYIWQQIQFLLLPGCDHSVFCFFEFKFFFFKYYFLLLFSSVQSLTRVCFFATPWTAACQAFLSITNSQSLPKLMSIELVMPTNHIILCRRLLLLPSIFPTIRVFSNESALCNRWPKYWSFIFNVSPSNEHPGLISFRMDWLDHFAVQGTLKSLLQHHSSKASILQHSAFFILQLSHPYMTTGKTLALTRWTFVDKVISLLFNMLSFLVITFLPRSKYLLISWLQSPSAVILKPQNIKSATVSTVSPSICHEVMRPNAMISVFWMLSFKSTFSLSSFTFIERLFSFSSIFAIRVVSSAYLRLLIFLPAILIPACASPAQHFSWCTLHIS